MVAARKDLSEDVIFEQRLREAKRGGGRGPGDPGESLAGRGDAKHKGPGPGVCGVHDPD